MNEETQRLIDMVQKGVGKKPVWYNRTEGQHNFAVVTKAGKFYGAGVKDENAEDGIIIDNLIGVLKRV